MNLKKVEIAGVEYIIQAYKKDDFANIVMVEPRLFFSICFVNKTIDTNSKRNSEWNSYVSKINVDEVKTILDNYFNK